MLAASLKFIKLKGFFQRQVVRAVVTWTLIALNAISWCLVAWLYGLSLFKAHNSYLLLRVGAVNGDLLWTGEWWRIISSQFLHVYLAHLVFNMAALLFLGVELERSYGSLRFALLYVISGSIGQVVGVATAPELVVSGASQAMMGIAGATVFHLLRQRGVKTVLLIVLLIVVGIQLGLDIIAARTIKAGHWSSLCAGMIVGYILTRYPKKT
jgi:rhomboid protease GluP